jgi:hypothetical protein
MNTLKNLAASICAVGLSFAAHATPITSAGDAALIGATLEDFNAASIGTFSGTVSFANVDLSSASFVFETGSAGQHAPPNPSGDVYVRSTANNTMTFTFGSGVSAFGFVIGATNHIQTLTAFDTGGNFLESLAIPDQVQDLPSPFTSYHGIASGGSLIGSFTVTSFSDVWVLDDLSFQSNPVPEPTTLAIFTLGLLGLGAARRRKIRAA